MDPRKFSAWIGEPPNGCYSQANCSFMNIVFFLPDIMVPSIHFVTMYCQVVVLLIWIQQVGMYFLLWFALLYVLYTFLSANVIVIRIPLLSLQTISLHCTQAVNFIACGFSLCRLCEHLNMIWCWQFLVICWGYGHCKLCNLLNVSSPEDYLNVSQ